MRCVWDGGGCGVSEIGVGMRCMRKGVDEVCVWGWWGYSNGVISHT